MEEQIYVDSNGRSTAYFEYGTGANVLFFHHATQVAGPLNTFLKQQADSHHFRIVEVVRSGYGSSTSMPGRSVWQAAPAQIEIADHLKIDKFGIIGYSGGGPHALASVVASEARCVGAVIVAGLAPFAGSDFDFYDGMDEPNKQEWMTSQNDLEKFEADIAKYAEAWSEYDFEKVKSIFNSGPASAFSDEQLMDFFTSTKYSLQQGGNGIQEDSIAFIKPWGFSIADVNSPIQIWAGTSDVNAPVSHAKWMHDYIPESEIHVLEGFDHNSIVEPAWTAGFKWLLDAF